MMSHVEDHYVCGANGGAVWRVVNTEARPKNLKVPTLSAHISQMCKSCINKDDKTVTVMQNHHPSASSKESWCNIRSYILQNHLRHPRFEVLAPFHAPGPEEAQRRLTVGCVGGKCGGVLKKHIIWQPDANRIPQTHIPLKKTEHLIRQSMFYC